jgi:hypothetical protein
LPALRRAQPARHRLPEAEEVKEDVMPKNTSKTSGKSAAEKHREAVAAQDKAWREKGQREQGGSREGWGI